MVIPEAGGRLIMASDGVWDVLCPKFMSRISKHAEVSQAARIIMDRVLLSSSGNLQDDATVMIVELAPTKAHVDCKKSRWRFGRALVGP